MFDRIIKEDPLTREAITKLAEELGMGKPTYYDALQEVNFYPTIHGDRTKRPVSGAVLKQYMEELNSLQSNFYILLNHLGLEIFEGKELRKKTK